MPNFFTKLFKKRLTPALTTDQVEPVRQYYETHGTFKQTHFETAVLYNSFNVLEYMLSCDNHGIQINAHVLWDDSNDRTYTALNYAIKGNRFDIMICLIAHGATLSKKHLYYFGTSFPCPARVLTALAASDQALAKIFLAFQFSKFSTDDTLLAFLQSLPTPTIQSIIQFVDPRQKRQDTILHYVLYYDKPKSAAWLIHEQADFTKRNHANERPIDYLSRLDPQGYDLVFHTVLYIDPQYANTYLWFKSIGPDNESIFEQLLTDQHLDIDLQTTDRQQKTALHLAIEKNLLNLACFLIEHGANLNKTDRFEKTPLDYLKPQQDQNLANLFMTLYRQNCYFNRPDYLHFVQTNTQNKIETLNHDLLELKNILLKFTTLPPVPTEIELSDKAQISQRNLSILKK